MRKIMKVKKKIIEVKSKKCIKSLTCIRFPITNKGILNAGIQKSIFSNLSG